MRISDEHLQELYALFAAVENEEEARKLLMDILTPQELESIAERWQLVQKLAKGVPQREIAEELGISISKITRGSRVMQYGEGGLKLFIEKLQR